MSDSEIIKLILQGNTNEFRLLVERYQSLVFRTCMGFLHNKEDADDLSQEVFIQAYQSLPHFKGESSFSTWLYRITVNTSLNKLRKAKKNFFFESIEKAFYKESISNIDISDPEKIFIQEEHRQWVQKALNRLPENQRTAIVLSKYDDLSQKEIAEIMKVTEGAVEALIQRAKANLRDILSASIKKNKKLP